MADSSIYQSNKSNEISAAPKFAEENKEANAVKEALKKVIKKWWLFLLIGAAAGFIGIIYAARQTVMYESYLTFALDEGGSEGGVSVATGLAAQFGISLGGAKDVFTGDNILEVILSRRIIEKVLLSAEKINNHQVTFIEYYLQNIKEPGSSANKIFIFYPVKKKQHLAIRKIVYCTLFF